MKKISSKIFIDGGDPKETEEAKRLLGNLAGQTTNPTLIAKNLKEQKTLNNKQIREEDALKEYQRIVEEINKIIPQGSISIQVFANKKTTSEEMLKQARERNRWIPNASIKFPCTHEGLQAASVACREMAINITLVFSQSQAAAVYEATRGAQYPVFISPFVGRLDDRGENGMEVVANILRMFKECVKGPEPQRRVEVLTASVRTLDHILYALQLGSDIITIPFKVFKVWADERFQTPSSDYVYPVSNLKPITYEEILLGRPWQEYDLDHDLTDIGIEKFFADWNEVTS